MEFGLFQQQSTSLIMTQELRQAIHLLQFSATDLSTFIHEQALENPLLDVQEPPKAVELGKRERIELHSYTSISYSQSDQEERQSPIDYALVDRISLNDHLLQQLQEISLSRSEREKVTYFIYSLRDDGYLSRSLEDVCDDLTISRFEGEEILHILQRLEPAGVGARNLQECLLLQLQRLETRHPLAEQVVMLYMDDLAKRKWRDISTELGVTLQDIQEVNDLIQTLDPRPGTQFGVEPIQFVTPELRIIADGSELFVQLVDDIIPTIRLNRHYEQLLRNEREVEATHYAKQKAQQVQWLIRSIAQRKQTIIKVGEAIARHQREYFLTKNGVLKPLTLKEVAEEIGVHESTVSRATTNKYAETPRGLLELKSLFSSSVRNDIGETTSSQTIKDWMKELIARENKQKPLSDAKIVKSLQEEKGIVVSRRAIAKYRDELGIPSSSKRKRFE
ncbi:RNA polymerase factor sigma-54 [Halalkalibacter nanhaiisediminis]|uniref:RNA polymerase RpoN-/SigL-like sigma 54 subunit n=1 Tax=Halalkalibacter nanhaiisediminis TaxID=688079 RepID=A0A562QTA7_9BACI|nr:RNA polymerase factor sigma-54 [Halalkalibacter nanhaiisediminis]TWI60018.1 RNA polymerase RpoN-/SigL-like sigma 54 subunit [Halalkalibacter nanhaiisediminis]